MAAMQWRESVDAVVANTGGLKATTRGALSVLIDIDAEVEKRGAPYPQSLAYLVAMCRSCDPDLVDFEPPAGGEHSVGRLLKAFADDGVPDWSALGRSAAAWLADLLR